MSHNPNDVAYVTADGTFGTGDILIFHPDAVTDAQWLFLSNLCDSDRYEYTQAVLAGDLVKLAQLHSEYEDN